MSTGEGKPKEVDNRLTTVFRRNPSASYSLKRDISRKIFSEVSTKYGSLPFSLRWLEDAAKARFGIGEARDHDLVYAYPVLAEEEGEIVASSPQQPLAASFTSARNSVNSLQTTDDSFHAHTASSLHCCARSSIARPRVIASAQACEPIGDQRVMMSLPLASRVSLSCVVFVCCVHVRSRVSASGAAAEFSLLVALRSRSRSLQLAVDLFSLSRRFKFAGRVGAAPGDFALLAFSRAEQPPSNRTRKRTRSHSHTRNSAAATVIALLSQPCRSRRRCWQT